MSKFGIQSYWLDGLSDFYHIWYNWHNRNEPAQTIIHIIHKFIHKEKSDIKILDCACGVGNPSLSLSRMGYNVLSSDGSAKMLKKAAENAQHLGIELNIKRKPILWTEIASFFPEQEFDVVVCTGNSFCHIQPEGIRLALKQMFSVLKSGGICIFDVKRYSARIRELDYEGNKGWFERTSRTDRRRIADGKTAEFKSRLVYRGQNNPGRKYNIQMECRYSDGRCQHYLFPVWATTSSIVLEYMSRIGMEIQPVYPTSNPSRWRYDFCIGVKLISGKRKD